MTPRLFLHVFFLTLALAGGAQAQGYADDVVRQLSGQGYGDISVTTTFLGRVRILAEGEGGHREIILNPRTGEILRDLWITAGGAAPKVSIVEHPSSGSGSGSGSGDDDDDGGSGSDDDDNSGSGSGGDDDDSGGDDSGDDQDDDEDKGKNDRDRNDD